MTQLSYSQMDTIAHLIQTNKSIELDDLLDIHQIDPNDIMIDGTSLLSYAIQSKSLDCIRILLKHKIDINKQNPRGNTNALMDACDRFRLCNVYEAKVEYAKIIEYLVECGADCNGQNKQGSTALMMLCGDVTFQYHHLGPEFAMCDRAKLVKLLLNNGADRTLLNRYNLTAETIALSLGNNYIVTVVREYQPDPICDTKGVYE